MLIDKITICHLLYDIIIVLSLFNSYLKKEREGKRERRVQKGVDCDLSANYLFKIN